MVLVGSMILLGLHWAALGLVVALGALIYVSTASRGCYMDSAWKSSPCRGTRS
jgi:hypothetical protein